MGGQGPPGRVHSSPAAPRAAEVWPSAVVGRKWLVWRPSKISVSRQMLCPTPQRILHICYPRRRFMRTTEKPVARPSDLQINPPLCPLTFYPTISKYPPQILRHLAHNSPYQEAAVEPIDIVKLSLVPPVTGSMTCNTSAYAALKTGERLQ